ncbi:MAG: UbiA family prenyltransferase [Beijerinckiaceae bacterium]
MLQKSSISAHIARRSPNTGQAASPERRPLVLDLDQTLLRSDLLVECLVAMVRERPSTIFRVAGWLMRGKAHLKRKVAEYAHIDPADLPVNEEVAAFAAGRKSEGQRVVIATAADETAARRLLARFPFVDEVIGSDGVRNLKGEAKARLLQMRFPQGFDYAGDSAADLPVWRASAGMILVEPKATVARAAERIKPADLHFRRPPVWNVWARALRLHQWVKNALVFAPLLLSGMIGDTQAWGAALLAFVGLGLTASATYVLNDLIDLPHDRKHRSKSGRPLASGRMPLAHGMALAGLALPAGLAMAALAGTHVLGGVLVYLAATILYSVHLKRIPFLDTATLAGLFTLRLGIGIVATGAPPSTWLLAFSMFLFLSLSLAKRFVEIASMRGRGRIALPGRGYRTEDEPVVAGFGVASAVASIVLFVLYLSNEGAVKATFIGTELLWIFPVLLFLWLSRIWILSARGEMKDDPVAFSIRDRVSLWLGALSFCLFAVAIGWSAQ